MLVVVSSVMYGFGDSREQLPEALDLMNNIVLEYITGMTNEALRYSYGDEITVQALRCVIRNDLRKDDRVKQLCHMYDKVTEQRDHMHKLKDDIRKEQEQSRNNEPSGTLPVFKRCHELIVVQGKR